jgi:hypothetical protein
VTRLRVPGVRPAIEVTPLIVLGFLLLDRPSAIAFAVVATGLRVLRAVLATDGRPDARALHLDHVAVVMEKRPSKLELDPA